MKGRSDWSAWSAPQLRALLGLDVVPLHETHLRRNHRVRGPTITVLVQAGLVPHWFGRDCIERDCPLKEAA